MLDKAVFVAKINQIYININVMVPKLKKKCMLEVKSSISKKVGQSPENKYTISSEICFVQRQWFCSMLHTGNFSYYNTVNSPKIQITDFFSQFIFCIKKDS